MLQRLPIALVSVKASNNSESLLNETRQIVYSLYQSKEITKNACNSIMKWIQIQKVGTIFINSENSKTSKPHILIVKLTDKLEEVKKILLYQILVFTLHGKYKMLIQQ